MSAVFQSKEVPRCTGGRRTVRECIRTYNDVSYESKGGGSVSSFYVRKFPGTPRWSNTVLLSPGHPDLSSGVLRRKTMKKRSSPPVRSDPYVGSEGPPVHPPPSVPLSPWWRRVLNGLSNRNGRTLGNPKTFSRNPSGNIKGVSGV